MKRLIFISIFFLSGLGLVNGTLADQKKNQTISFQVNCYGRGGVIADAEIMVFKYKAASRYRVDTIVKNGKRIPKPVYVTKTKDGLATIKVEAGEKYRVVAIRKTGPQKDRQGVTKDAPIPDRDFTKRPRRSLLYLDIVPKPDMRNMEFIFDMATLMLSAFYAQEGTYPETRVNIYSGMYVWREKLIRTVICNEGQGWSNRQPQPPVPVKLIIDLPDNEGNVFTITGQEVGNNWHWSERTIVIDEDMDYTLILEWHPSW